MVPVTTKHYGLFPHVHAFIPRDCAAKSPAPRRKNHRTVRLGGLFRWEPRKTSPDDANQNRWDLWMFNCLYPPENVYYSYKWYWGELIHLLNEPPSIHIYIYLTNGAHPPLILPMVLGWLSVAILWW